MSLTSYDVDENTGCWIWNRMIRADGYGRLSGHLGRKLGTYSAHRAMYEQEVGPIPDGKHLHHTCEHRSCVNPAHLQPMTQSEHNKMHAYVGGGPWRPRTEREVEDRVLELRGVDLSYKQIAAITGLHFTTVGVIIRRRAKNDRP